MFVSFGKESSEYRGVLNFMFWLYLPLDAMIINSEFVATPKNVTAVFLCHVISLEYLNPHVFIMSSAGSRKPCVVHMNSIQLSAV